MALMPVSIAGSTGADIATSVSSAGHMWGRTSPVHEKPWVCWQMNRCEQGKRCATLSLIRFGRDLYSWLARKMDIPVEDCHFGYFDIDQLRRAYIILRGIQDKQMRYDNCGRIYFEEAAHEV